MEFHWILLMAKLFKASLCSIFLILMVALISGAITINRKNAQEPHAAEEVEAVKDPTVIKNSLADHILRTLARPFRVLL